MTDLAAFKMLINGHMVAGTSTFDVINPATEDAVGRAPEAEQADLDAAVVAARNAFPAWAARSIEERRAVIIAMADRLREDVDEMKRLLTSEQGKPHQDAEREVLGAASWLKGAASLDLPREVLQDDAERRVETIRVPLGVVGAISPWNFPLVLAMVKVAPALLSGNTMVLKPSPFTPLTTLRFAELVSDIVPPGVLNVVTGTDRLGPWLTGHPGIDKVSFTGSTATGRRVMESAAHSLKRVTLELGGNDAAIVMPDVDVEKVAPELFWAAFRNSGQICIATKRMYVHADIYQQLRDAIIAYAKTVKVGDGAEQGSQIGPVNNRAQYDRVNDLIADSRARGHHIVLGGEAIEGPGFFIPITIVDNPPEDSRIVQEEQFGPVLPLLRFETVDEALSRANASEYGLGGTVWSGDADMAQAIAERLSTGTVWINEPQNLNPTVPFGGMRQSGMGVENGREGLMEYTAAKTIATRKLRPALAS